MDDVMPANDDPGQLIPWPVQMLAPPDDQGGAGTDAPPEDASDLFKQIQKPAQ